MAYFFLARRNPQSSSGTGQEVPKINSRFSFFHFVVFVLIFVDLLKQLNITQLPHSLNSGRA